MEISLALGSGGSRGNAHIGVLKVLEREGYQVKAIAGTSAGGIAGAIYAAGYSASQMEEVMRGVDMASLYKRGTNAQPSLLGLAGVEDLLTTLIGDKTFDQLDIPFAVCAVDLKTGREIVIDQGRVVDAVLATIAIPGIFPAKEREEYLLVDGAVSDPVPVDPVRKLAPKLPVVAVVLNPGMQTMENMTLPSFTLPHPMLAPITRLKVAQAFNVFYRSMDINGYIMTELRLQLDKPEVIIRPDMQGVDLLSPKDIKEIIDSGEAAAEAKLEELKKAVSLPQRMRRVIRK